MTNEKCKCGSGKFYNQCCKPFIKPFFNKPILKEDLLIYSWLTSFSSCHINEFEKMFRKYLFRLSHYYNYLEYITDLANQKYKGEMFQLITGIQLNIRHSLLAAITTSASGLFLQGDIILRSAFEDSLVLFDIAFNNIPFEKINSNKYNINSLISRIKKCLPSDIIQWYGYLSANFTHYNIIHTTPYIPTKCHADNTASVIAFQNMIRTIITYHIILEYLYYDYLDCKLFWKNEDKKFIINLNDSPIFHWIDMFRDELLSEFNPNERKNGIYYSEKSYKFK